MIARHPERALVIPSEAFVTLSEAFVILSEAKDLGRAGAAKQMLRFAQHDKADVPSARHVP